MDTVAVESRLPASSEDALSHPLVVAALDIFRDEPGGPRDAKRLLKVIAGNDVTGEALISTASAMLSVSGCPAAAFGIVQSLEVISSIYSWRFDSICGAVAEAFSDSNVIEFMTAEGSNYAARENLANALVIIAERSEDLAAEIVSALSVISEKMSPSQFDELISAGVSANILVELAQSCGMEALSPAVDTFSLFKRDRDAIEGTAFVIYNTLVQHIKGYSDQDRTDDIKRISQSFASLGANPHLAAAVGSVLFESIKGARTKEAMRNVLSNLPSGPADCRSFLNGYLTGIGIQGSEMLDEEELALLAHGYRTTEHVQTKHFNTFIKQRTEGLQYAITPALPPGMENAMRTQILGLIPISNAKYSVGIDNGLALKVMVYGINGSRDDPKLAGQMRKMLFDMQLLEPNDRVGMAVRAWSKKRKDHINALRNALLSNDFFGAVSVFRKAGREVGGPDGEALMDLVDNMAGLQNAEKKRGDHIVAYTVMGKDNVLRIKSDNTWCCAFYPNGNHKEACINYAIDPSVVLVNFSIVFKDELMSGKLGPLERLEVDGVAICACAELDGSKVLFVDSLEGGNPLKGAIKGQEGQVLGMLRTLAGSIMVPELVVSNYGANSLPKRFIQAVEGDVTEASISLLNEVPLFIENRGEKGVKRFPAIREG